MLKFSMVLLTASVLCYSVFSAEDKNSDVTIKSSSEISMDDFTPNPILSLHPIAIHDKIEIDGILEPIWYQSAIFKNFTEFEPTENKKPDVLTSGYLAYDTKNLFIAFICQDPDISQLRSNLTDRDNIFQDDWVNISIDPNKENQIAYQFYANAYGIQGDRLWQANGTEDESFDLVWESEGKIYEDHWIVEMKIPFESLRYPQHKIQNWSVHLTRSYPRDNEFKYSWMPISANNNSYMQQAGNLIFNIPQHSSENKTLEILPYVISTQESFKYEELDRENWQHDKPDARMGIGLKYGFSTNFIADFTYNPDFSQIESDAGQISINNPFALFFQEKRPFFQEGSESYVLDHRSFGIAVDQFVNLFYSRSINDPKFAGKISSKFGKFSMGFTSAYDRNTPFVIPFEERSSFLSTQLNSYSNILRTRYELGNQSYIGLLLTDRHLAKGGSNSVMAIDANFRISEKYNLLTIVGFTYTKEPNDPELSDQIGEGTFKVGKEMKTTAFDGESFYGRLLRAKLNRNSRHWVGTLAFQDFSPGFRADNGFIQSNSFRTIECVTGYFFRLDNSRVFTFIRPRISLWRKYNYEGIVKDTGIRTNILFSFRKQTIFNISAFLFNRENLYGKQFGNARQIWMYTESRTLKSIIPSFFISIGEQINRFGVDGDPHNPFEIVPSLNYSLGLTYKPTPQFSNQLEFQEFQLWTNFGKDKIMGQKIIRDIFNYQFNKRMILRLIGEYDIVDYYDVSVPGMVQQKYFTLEPMFSYKLNAFSVFYLGGHFGGWNNFYINREEMKLMNQSFFVKFQYLIRS